MSACPPTKPETAAEDEPVEWTVLPGRAPYEATVEAMEARAQAIRDGTAAEAVWLVEHDPLYTAGTSADPADLIDSRFPVHATGRGGQYTYHGPGQRVAYVLLDLKKRNMDVRGYVCDLESWLIATLAAFGVRGERRDGRVGIWVQRPGITAPREDKVAAIGVRVRRWVTFHGVALNVAPDLGHFSGIVPCGIREHGVTSLADLGATTDMAIVDKALRNAFEAAFKRRTRPVSARL